MGTVRVWNATRRSMVAEHADVARTPVRRLRGLMGRRAWAEADGLLIRPCNAIHTLFMRLPIDVIFVDRANVVLEIAPARPPWRLGPIVWRARWALELPEGAIARSGTRLDDRLDVEEMRDAPAR